MALQVYGLKNCDTCKKAMAALVAAGREVIFVDIRAEAARLKARGVVFRSEPQEAGPIIVALFEDTCGNLINLVQPLM